jgi:hypothetical protein
VPVALLGEPVLDRGLVEVVQCHVFLVRPGCRPGVTARRTD